MIDQAVMALQHPHVLLGAACSRMMLSAQHSRRCLLAAMPQEGAPLKKVTTGLAAVLMLESTCSGQQSPSASAGAAYWQGQHLWQ